MADADHLLTNSFPVEDALEPEENWLDSFLLMASFVDGSCVTEGPALSGPAVQMRLIEAGHFD